METGAPPMESASETSREEIQNRLKIVAILKDAQYLLTVGFFLGQHAEKVAITKQFLIDFAAHLEGKK